MQLSGKNLGERQRDLNNKVEKAAHENVNFESVKNRIETTDIDKLFKIDLASKYKNIDYIIEILKSGDDLCISRALKCVWIFDDDYASYINPNFIRDNIFPFMSSQMRNKFVKAIALSVTNEKRAEDFYKYCKCPNNNMPSSVDNFLIRTSESFKLENLESVNAKILKSFIGTSFILAEAYVNKQYYKNSRLHKIRYLYHVSGEKYLDLFEKHYQTEYSMSVFCYRISSNIIKNNKNRIFNNPLLYALVLNKDALRKYTTYSDAKLYLVSLLPKNEQLFWQKKFKDTYDCFIKKIPIDERYGFLKEIFTNKYPKAEYEMCLPFYKQNYFVGMSQKDKEDWALRHVASKAELLGPDQDYNWYKFISYDKAFVEVKKYILITPDAAKRTEIVKILIESAKSQNELEQLLNYFYERHVNEDRRYKEDFLDTVYKHHKVFDFKGSCWAAYDKILYSIDVYNALDNSYNNNRYYKIIALIYHIIKYKPVPALFQTFVDEVLNVDHLSTYIKDLTVKSDQEKVYQYILKIYLNKFSELEIQAYNDEISDKAYNYIEFVQNLMAVFKKEEDETPEIVTKYKQLDSRFDKIPEPDEQTEVFLTEGDMLRLLKEDATLLVKNIPKVEKTLVKKGYIKLNTVMRKLRVYFSQDIAEDYLNFCKSLLRDPKSIYSIHLAVYGIFELADNAFKSDFVNKFVPTETKINHSTINRNNLYIQESICRYACLSRPPVPLEDLRQYIKGDYVHYCVPRFNTYMAILRPNERLEFVKSLLDTPVSVQKHGLRFAFKCFNAKEIQELITNVWKNTKNLSLRMILYTSLFKYLKGKDETQQNNLFELLKTFTSQLNQDDHEDIMSILTNSSLQLPDHLKGDYLVTAWTTFKRFPDNMKNTKRKLEILKSIRINLIYINKQFVKGIVDDHILSFFVEKSKQNQDMIDEKWQLVEAYIYAYEHDEDAIQVVRDVIAYCLKIWDEVKSIETNYQTNSVYTIRKFFFKFIKGVISSSDSKPNPALINPLLEAILTDISTALPVEQIYHLMWDIKMNIIVNKCIDYGNEKIKADIKEESKKEDIVALYKEIGCTFAKQVGNYITELVTKQSFPSLLFFEFTYILTARINKLVRCLRVKDVFINNTTNMLLYVANTLLEFKITEAYFLAARILPEFTANTPPAEEYVKFMNTVQTLDDINLKCCMLERFQSSGYIEHDLINF